MRFSTTTIFMIIGLYVVFLCAVLYFCVYADPEESKVAQYVTKTLPDQVHALVLRFLPKRIVQMLEFFSDRFLMMFYCAVLFGSWSIVLFYVFPWVHRQTYVAHYHKYIGIMFFGACMVSWRYASTTSPGIITLKNWQVYDHFPYDHFLFVPGLRCKTTGIPRLPRSKFDRYKYQANVPRFDHFCGWVFNTIGEENYRFFLLFLLIHVVACTYGTVILGALFYGHLLEYKLFEARFIDRLTGEEFDVTYWLLFQYLFDRFFLESAVFLLMTVMSVALGLFLAYHVWLTSRGMTTNEAYKWDQVRKWYKTELKRYNEAVAKGQINPNADNGGIAISNASTMTSRPTVPDGDVTCTGGVKEESPPVSDDNNASSAQPEPKRRREEVVEHPGPEPKNVYNRGFVENWKEVIFPISLRKETIAAAQQLSSAEKEKKKQKQKAS